MSNGESTLAAVGALRPQTLELLDPNLPVEVLCSASGLLPDSGQAQESLARAPERRLSAGAVGDYKRQMLAHLAQGLDHLEQTNDWEARVLAWLRHMDEDRARFVLSRRNPVFMRMLSRPDASLVRGGPLSAKLDELCLELTGTEHARARAWLEGQIGSAEDITDEVRAVLAGSWAAELIGPRDLYHKVLYEYFASTLDGLDRQTDANPMLERLTDFQQEAYHFAKGILRRFGGVFLADVVGLGKTWIAMALLRYLHDRYGHDAVVIAPPAVLPAWRTLAEEHRVPLGLVSIGKLDDLDRFGDREILVVDESHNFRNQGTARYERVQEWLRPDGAPSSKQVLLLSATPQNNDPMDVYAQLQLFPDNYARLPYQGESLEEWFRAARGRPADLAQLLQHVVVRRTRTFIRAAYPDATLTRPGPDGTLETQPLRFPERISGPEQCLRYRLDDGPSGAQIYDRTMQRLEHMRYPLHGLGQYVRPDHAGDPRVARFRRTGRGLRGLYKVLLLKRLESSLFAFRLSAKRLRERLSTAIADLARGVVRVRGGQVTEDAEDDAVVESGTAELPSALFVPARLLRDLQADQRSIQAILDDIEVLRLEADPKLGRLEQWLAERPPTTHRTILFTQFGDTATWLAERLGQRFGRTAVVTGGTPGRDKLTVRFSPVSNRADVPEGDQLDLLVSTDALSEGVNLQDADTLINYDLHWNPVRLIQRAGRIDRIGSENDEIVVASFLPESGLEKHLGLEEVLRRRIAEFLQVFGEDSEVLPAGDTPALEAMVSAYTGDALRQADAEDDMDALSRHVSRILHLRRHEPERFASIAELRPGRRAASTANGPAVAACRVGWFWRFWRRSDAGDGGGELTLIELDDVSGLEALYRHSQADPAAGPRPDAGQLARAARAAFEADARTFLQLRAHPRLSKAEDWVVERLDRYLETCVPTQRELVGELREWVLRGHGRAVLRREARSWKRQKLSATPVFHEVRRLAARFPGATEDLGEPALVGVVVGQGSS